jgi:hydrogenase maturation protease
VTGSSDRVLVAGLGNIFLGDDAFGVEVVRRLSTMALPDDVRLVDVGIRSVHLAYELRERTYDRVILIDSVSKGGEPGTVYILEPEADDAHNSYRAADGHAIHPHDVIGLVRQLGGRPPQVIVVGCEPCLIGPDAGLSPAVASAVGHAAQLVTTLVSSVTPFTTVRT